MSFIYPDHICRSNRHLLYRFCKWHMSWSYEIGVHDRKTRFEPDRAECRVLECMQLIRLDMRRVVCGKCVYRVVLDTFYDRSHMFLGAQRRIHLSIRIITKALRISERKMLYGRICRDILRAALFCFPDRTDSPGRGIVREMESCTGLLSKKDVLVDAHIFGERRRARESELRRYPSLMHDAVFRQILRLAVAHDKHPAGARVFHVALEDSLMLHIDAVVSDENRA